MATRKPKPLVQKPTPPATRARGVGRATPGPRVRGPVDYQPRKGGGGDWVGRQGRGAVIATSKAEDSPRRPAFGNRKKRPPL